MIDAPTVALVKQGDRMLVTYGADRDPDEVQHVLQELRQRFPSVEFTVLLGAEQVIVQRAEDHHNREGE